jgi:hypothetical protein
MNRKEEKAVRLISILTMAGWTKSDIVEAIQYLEATPEWRLLEVIKYVSQDLSKLTNNLSQSTESFYSPNKHFYSKESKSNQNNGENETIVKMINILSSELKLSTNEIVDAVSYELQKKYPDTAKLIPGLSKKSLYNWFERILNLYSASEILHIVTLLRNQKTHSNRLDWSVRNEKP